MAIHRGLDEGDESRQLSETTARAQILHNMVIAHGNQRCVVVPSRRLEALVSACELRGRQHSQNLENYLSICYLKARFRATEMPRKP